MAYQSIVISSGHSTHVRGASGHPGLDEVNEVRIFVDSLADELRKRGVTVKTYHDTVSKNQDENLKRIVDYHNAQKRELDISVHMNAYQQTATKPMGTEVLYVSQAALAEDLSHAIATSGGFIDRGAKYRDNLYVLNNTSAPAVLLELCFCDSEPDCKLYKENFALIVGAVADVLTGVEGEYAPPPSAVKPADVYTVTGTCSHFGGPDDMGVSPSEGLAFIYNVDDAPQLFLPFQPEGTTGLARRLNPYVHYFACRFDYAKMPKTEIIKHMGLVTAKKTGIAIRAFPADWGPHEEKTGRAADLSPKLMEDLGIETDDEITVVFPWEG